MFVFNVFEWEDCLVSVLPETNSKFIYLFLIIQAQTVFLRDFWHLFFLYYFILYLNIKGLGVTVVLNWWQINIWIKLDIYVSGN